MPKILESEALTLAQNIDTLSDAEKPLALDILKRYQAQQWDNGEPEWPTQARSQEEGDARFRSMFEDLKNVDKAAPSLADALQYSDNPDADRARVASIAYLSRVYGKPADEIGSSLDLYRNDYTTRRGQKGTDDLGFYKLAAAEVAAMKRKEDTALEGAKAALRGEDVIASLQAWQAKNLDRIPDSTEFTKGYLKAKEGAGDYLPIADELLKLMESGTGKSTRPFDSAAANRLDEIAGELATMKPRERKQVYASISARAEAAGYEQKGFWSQMLGELDKGLYRMSSTLGTQAGIASDLASNIPALLAEGMTGNRDFGMTPSEIANTDASIAKRQALGEMQSELAAIVSGEIDPVRPTISWLNDTLETGLIKGPGAVAPFVGASAVLGPWGSGILFTADFAEQNRRDLRAMGMDNDKAMEIGVIAAPLQAAVESLSNMVQLGGFTKLQTVLAGFTKPIGGGAGLAVRYAQNAGISLATEFTEEQLQDNFIVPAVQEIVGALAEDVPEVDWSFFKTRAAESTPELLSVLAPMALVFGGAMTNAQANLSRDMTGNIDALKALNYSEVQAVEVVSEKTEDARIAKARSLWASRAGDKITLYSGAKNLAERMRQLSGDAMAQQRELKRRGKLPILRPMAYLKWLMTIPSDGSTATFDSHQEADKARWTWTEDQLGKVHALTRETLASMEKNLNVGREVAVEFVPDIRTAQDAVNEGASVEQIKNRVEQGKALGDISPDTSFEDAQAIDKATTEADGFLSSLRILGSSKNEFKDGILRTTIKLWEGSNILTLVEEKLEGDAKAIIMEPKGREWMLSRLRNYEQASGDKLFRELPDEQLTNEDLVEAWSHLGQSYLVGRSTFGEPLQKKAMRRFGRLLMRSGLTGAMNAESSFFAAVASRAQKLGELKQAGKLSDDLVSELEKQLGIDSQVSHDAAAAKEADAIASEAVDTSGYSPETPGPNGETFSLSKITPAQDAEYLAAVQAGDMDNAQRMVDEAAKRAGYDVKAYHGTDAAFTTFTPSGSGEFGPGIYLTNNESAAMDYAKGRLVGDEDDGVPQVMSGWVRLKKPFVVKEGVSPSGDLDNLGIPDNEWRSINRKLQNLGFDGIRVDFNRIGEGSDFVLFNPSQIKSADPVTRDESGKIVPLSQRFNPADNRITFSIRLGKVTPAQDAEYAKAVADGDMEKAQAMVDAAAKDAGYQFEAWHGSANGRVTIFDPRQDPGYYEGREMDSHGDYSEDVAGWFSNSKKVGESYLGQMTGNKDVPSKPFAKETIPWDEPNADLPHGFKLHVWSRPKTKARGLRSWGWVHRPLTAEEMASDTLPQEFLTPTGRPKAGVSLQGHFPNDTEIGGYQLEGYKHNPRAALSRIRDIYKEPLPMRDGAALHRVYLQYSNPKVEDFQGGKFKAMGKRAANAFRDGHDAFIAQNVRDPGAAPYRVPVADSIAIPSPQQIKSADPITRDAEGNVIPLSQRFNPGDNRITYSIRPGDFSARMEAKFSLFQAKPELRLAIAQVAKERALRLGAEWIAKGDVIRTAKDIGKEARMREALAYEARMNEYLDGLTPNARQTLEFEPSALEDDPLVAAMLDFGKLMSFTTAKKSGKVEAKSGDYDGQPWLPPAWFSKGAGIMPDQMAQAMFDAGMLPDAYTGTLWSELEKRIEATRKDKAAHREAVQAYKAAEKYARDASRAEADQWAENAKKQAGSPKAQRDMLKAALRTLDGILAAAPPEVRARVGGYVKLAGLATDEAMLQEIERRIEKLNVELEKYLKKEYRQQIAKFFKKYAPKKDDKGRITSNITADAAEDIGFAFDFASMDDANQEKEMAALEKTLEESEDSTEIQDAIGKLAIVNLFHKLEERESSELEAAAMWLKEVGSGAREARKLIDAARAEAVKKAKNEAKKDASNGKLSSLPDAENVEADVRSSTFNRFTNDVKGFLNSALFTLGQQLEIVFGQDSKITTEFHRRAVRAANDSTDIKRDIEARRAEFVAKLFGTKSRIQQAGRMGALTVPTTSGVMIEAGGKTTTIDVPAEIVLRIIEGSANLKALGFTNKEASTLADAWADNEALPAKRQKRIFKIERRSDGKNTELTMSQDEAIQYLLWSNQKASREQMERDGWSKESFQQLNAFLSDDAKALAGFFADEYARIGRLIEPVYRRMFHAPFPQVTNYSPIFRDISSADSIIDIDQQGHGSGVSSGFILARNKNARAALRRTSAISAFMQHAESAAHWVSHVELVRDLRSVLIDKEVQNAIRSNGRTAAANGIKKRVMQLENQGKVGTAGIAELDSWGSRLLQARAFKGLAWRISPVIKQASAYFNPLLADVPAWDYMRGTARLLRGKLEVSAMWKSPDIQRRIVMGFSAEAKIAMDRLGYTGSTLLAAMGKGMMPMSLVDAGWTTAGAAIAFDYYRRINLKSMNETLAENAALDQLEMMIAESAQPADAVNRSLIEGIQNPWLKSLWMFAGEQRKTLAIEIMALRRLATGKSKNKVMDVQRAVVAHVVMAATTQLMAGVLSLLMGDDDDREREWSVEEWAAAIAAGPINGLFLFGDAIDYAGRRLFGLHAFEPSTAIGQAVKTVSSTPGNLDKIINGEPEEQRKAFLRLGEAVGQAAALVGPGNPFTAADVILGNPLKDAEKILSNAAD